MSTATAAFTFDRYFEWLIPWEGTAYEVVPNDPGGATKYGIDQRTHPDVDIFSLTKAQAKAIYLSDYWRPSAGEKLPGRVAWAVTDCRVNCGPRASQWLQTILGVTADGIIGPVTLAAAKAPDERQLAKAILDRRESYYLDLGKQARFKSFVKGWLNRNHDLMKVVG